MSAEIGFRRRSGQLLTFAVSALMMLPANGCALVHIGGEEVAVVLERHQKGFADQGDAYAAVPAAPTTAPTATQATTASASEPSLLRDFIVVALRENPDIQAAVEIARARAERIAQVTALPDPTLLTKTLPEPTRTAEGDNFFILGIQQKLPVPEKLDRRGRVALEETRVALQAVQQTRLRVIGDVKRAYYQLYVVDRTAQLITDNQSLLRGLLEVVRAQVESGRAPQEDSLRAQVEISNLSSQLLDLRQRRVAAEAMLNTLLDRDPTTPIATPSGFGVREAELGIERLLQLAAAANPELRSLEYGIERDRQAVRLARLAYWPDFTLGFEWMEMEPRDSFEPPINPATGRRPPAPQLSEDGSDNWAIVFGFNLPIWFDKIEAGVREARYKLAASLKQYAAARNRVGFQIAEALERVRAQRELAILFDTAIIPQALQAYEVSRTGYSAGRSDFQYLIDNWQMWLTFSIQYHRAIGELERSVADLEQAIGLSITELEGGKGSDPSGTPAARQLQTEPTGDHQ